MTDIKIVGPTGEWVEEFDDQLEPTGEGYYTQVLIFEALGTDGQLHIQSLSMPDDIGEKPEFLERFRENGVLALEHAMRQKGAWPS